MSLKLLLRSLAFSLDLASQLVRAAPVKNVLLGPRLYSFVSASSSASNLCRSAFKKSRRLSLLTAANSANFSFANARNRASSAPAASSRFVAALPNSRADLTCIDSCSRIFLSRASSSALSSWGVFATSYTPRSCLRVSTLGI